MKNVLIYRRDIVISYLVVILDSEWDAHQWSEIGSTLQERLVPDGHFSRLLIQRRRYNGQVRVELIQAIDESVHNRGTVHVSTAPKSPNLHNGHKYEIRGLGVVSGRVRVAKSEIFRSIGRVRELEHNSLHIANKRIVACIPQVKAWLRAEHVVDGKPCHIISLSPPIVGQLVKCLIL